MTDFAPRAEVYLPEPKFKYAPPAKEVDFAQLVAAGQDITTALTLTGLVSKEEAQAASRGQLYRMGTRLLSSPAIQERIDYFLVLHKASMTVSVERLQQELAATAFADFALLYHPEDGPLMPDPFHPIDDPNPPRLIPSYRAGAPIRNPHDLPRHIRAAVKEWGYDKDGCLKAKFHDKLKAGQMLGDLQGYFAEADRAKAPQINISIGDGQGTAHRLPNAIRPATVEEAQVIEAPPINNNPNDLGVLG